MFISAVLSHVLPGHRRNRAGGPLVQAGSAELQTPHPSPLPGGQGRAGQPPGKPRFPSQRVPIPADTPRSPRGTGAELCPLCPPRPAPPRLRRSGRDTEEFRGGRPGPGWALRDGRVSSLRGQAGQGQRVPQSRLSLSSPRRSEFARGRPWGGRAEPPRCLRLAASPRSKSAESRSRSGPWGLGPAPPGALWAFRLRVGSVVLPHRLKIPPGRPPGRLWHRGRRGACARAGSRGAGEFRCRRRGVVPKQVLSPAVHEANPHTEPRYLICLQF